MKSRLPIAVVLTVALLKTSGAWAGPQEDAPGHPSHFRCGPPAPGALNVLAPPCAPCPPMAPPPPPGPRLCPEQLRKAGASDQQIDAVLGYQFEQELKQIDVRASVQKAALTLEHAKTATPVDEKAVMAAVEALGQAQTEVLKLSIAGELKIRQILGDEILRTLRDTPPPSDSRPLLPPFAMRCSPPDIDFDGPALFPGDPFLDAPFFEGL